MLFIYKLAHRRQTSNSRGESYSVGHETQNVQRYIRLNEQSVAYSFSTSYDLLIRHDAITHPLAGWAARECIPPLIYSPLPIHHRCLTRLTCAFASASKSLVSAASWALRRRSAASHSSRGRSDRTLLRSMSTAIFTCRVHSRGIKQWVLLPFYGHQAVGTRRHRHYRLCTALAIQSTTSSCCK